jgi:hypothetical protein
VRAGSGASLGRGSVVALSTQRPDSRAWIRNTYCSSRPLGEVSTRSILDMSTSTPTALSLRGTHDDSDFSYVSDWLGILSKITTALVPQPNEPCPVPIDADLGLTAPCWKTLANVHHGLAKAFHILSTDRNFGEQLDHIRSGTLLWVTLPRTQNEMRYLKDTPCRCPAATCGEYSHTRYDGEGIAPVGCFLQDVWTKLSTSVAVRTKDQVQVRPRRDPFAGRKQWPLRIQHLLPHGPEDTMRGMLSWLHADLGPIETGNMIRMLHYVLVMIHAHTLPYVLAARQTVPKRIIDLIRSGGSTRTEMTFERSIEEDADAIPKRTVVLNSAVQLLVDLAVTWSTQEQRRFFLAQHLAAILSLAEKAAKVVETSWYPGLSAISDAATPLYELTVQLCIDFPGLQASLSPSNFSRRLRMALAKHDDQHWKRLLRCVVRLQQTDHCASPDCTNAMVAGHGPFKHCGGCRRVIYCSAGCQKRSWRHVVAPHREVCASLRQTCLVNGLSHKRLNHAIPRPSGFVADDVEPIVQHFERQARHEIATSCE